MTIVLQHQFENLIVDADGFAVSLRFKGKPEQMVIPYAAITSFADPSVNFGLQLKTVSMDDEDLPTVGGDSDEDYYEAIEKLAVTEDNDDSADHDQPKTGEVIALDAFRNKRSCFSARRGAARPDDRVSKTPPEAQRGRHDRLRSLHHVPAWRG